LISKQKEPKVHLINISGNDKSDLPTQRIVSVLL